MGRYLATDYTYKHRFEGRQKEEKLDADRADYAEIEKETPGKTRG